MYAGLGTRPEESVGKSSRRGALNGTVVALGLTSFFTDISSEMVTAVIPVFLTAQLGFSPLAFGLFQGAYELANSMLRLFGGFVADRTRKPKETAAAGYGISTLTRVGLLGSAVAPLSAVPFLLIDRLGKGLRTGPRDAMISLATPEKAWGTAFGFHRTLDATGALIGPLIAAGMLYLLPGAYDSVFMLSVGFGFLGFAVIMTWVRNPEQLVGDRAPSGRSRLEFGIHLRNRGFRRILILGAGFGVFSVADSLIYLVMLDAAQEQSTVGVSGFGAEWFPLLFAGTAVAFLSTASTLGKIADRVGRARVWVAGHVFLAGAYAVLFFQPTSMIAILGVLALLGIYYGATDGVLPALAAGVIPETHRSGGLALLATAVASARMVCAVSFGLIWDFIGADGALLVAFCGLVATIVIASYIALVRDTTSKANA